MSLSIDVQPHVLAGGHGFALVVNAHYFNNSRGDVAFSPSRAICELLNAHGRVIEELCAEDGPPLMDTIHLEPRQSYDFEFTRMTQHNIGHGPHKLRVKVGDSIAEAIIH